MRERTAEGEAMERRRRRRRIARSVVDDASRLLSGPGLFARRTDRWAIVSRWLQHVRGCLKYRDRTGPPISLSLSLSAFLSRPHPFSTRVLALFRGKPRQKRVPRAHRDTHGRAGTCAPFPSGPSRWGIWAPVNGIVPILSSLPPPLPPPPPLFLRVCSRARAPRLLRPPFVPSITGENSKISSLPSVIRRVYVIVFIYCFLKKNISAKTMNINVRVSPKEYIFII